MLQFDHFFNAITSKNSSFVLINPLSLLGFRTIIPGNMTANLSTVETFHIFIVRFLIAMVKSSFSMAIDNIVSFLLLYLHMHMKLVQKERANSFMFFFFFSHFQLESLIEDQSAGAINSIQII